MDFSPMGSPLDEAALWPHLPTPGSAKAGLFFAYVLFNSNSHGKMAYSAQLDYLLPVK